MSRVPQYEDRLFNGVSQQPPHKRFPGQVERATNCVGNVFDGASVRPGTSFLVQLSGLDASGNYRLHPINRDENEQYLVIYGEGDLFVVNALTGASATVTINSAANTYLNLNSPTADQLRFRTIGDSTFIVNTTVEPGTQESSESYEVPQENIHRDYDVMTSYNPAFESYHQALEDTNTVDAGYFQFNLEENGFGSWTFDPPSSGWTNPRGLWDNRPANPMGFRARFQRQAIPNSATLDYNATTHILSATGAWSTYDWQIGDWVELSGGVLDTGGGDDGDPFNYGSAGVGSPGGGFQQIPE